MPVTEREVAAFAKRHRGQRAEMSVGGVSGLVARVAASGEVTYAVRDRAGRQRTMTIGDVSLAAARKKADETRAQAQVGVDPWEQQQAERMADDERRRAADRTLTRVADAWLASKEVAEWRAGTRRETERLLRKHILPVFGDGDPNAIVRAQVRKVLDEIAEDAPSEANHAFAAFRGLFGWLRKERQEHLGVVADPLRGLELPGGRRPPRDRVYSDDEVRRIFAAVRGTGIEDFVQLLAHTGVRDREARSMRWADVDFERAIWTIPADASKNRKPHIVALSSGALEVLRRRPRFGEFVFPNPATRTGYLDRPNHKVLCAVAVAAGLRRNVGTEEDPQWEGEALHLHDIRRTVGDRLKQEHGEAVMHGALGHADAALTKVYGPTPRTKVIAAALEWWAGELRRILGARAEARA